jgi:hypothetical protein
LELRAGNSHVGLLRRPEVAHPLLLLADHGRQLGGDRDRVLLRAAPVLGVEEPQVEGAAGLHEAVEGDVDERALAHPRVSEHLVGAPVVVVELDLVGRRVELRQLAVVEVAWRLLGLGADRQLARQVGSVRADRQAEDASVVEE